MKKFLSYIKSLFAKKPTIVSCVDMGPLSDESIAYLKKANDYADLKGANLSGANLSGANLSGANLSYFNVFFVSNKEQ